MDREIRMRSDKLSVVIPAHNEEKAAGAVLDELIEVLEGQSYEIIVVDDGSTDNTAKIAQKKDSVKLTQHPQNRRYGAAIKTGIKKATNDLILIIDGDGSYPVKSIPELLNEVDQYDMVVGARTGKEVKIQLYRRPAKWFLSKLANYLSETKIPDLNSGMRIFRRKDIEKFFNILPNKFSFTTTMTLACHTTGLLVKYVPINYYKRAGKSKIKPFKDGFNFIMLIFRTITYFNPLKFAFFVAAIFVFLYSAFFLGRFMDVTTIVLVVAAIQTVLFGLLADLVVRRSE
jgi:glycosyltransferase involved in cell wall biosynthesis